MSYSEKPNRYELKPCPFCGGKAKINKIEQGRLYEVECQYCYANVYDDTIDDVIEYWNRRTKNA